MEGCREVDSVGIFSAVRWIPFGIQLMLAVLRGRCRNESIESVGVEWSGFIYMRCY